MNLPEDFEDLGLELFYTESMMEEWIFFQNQSCNDDEVN